MIGMVRDKATSGVLLASVGFAPLPFASVLPWAWTGIAVVIALLCIHQALSSTDPLPREYWFIVIPFAFVVIWIVFQSEFGIGTHEIWEKAEAVLGSTVVRGSLDPSESRFSLVRLLSAAGVFWLSLNYCRREGNAEVLVYTMTIAGALYALYGYGEYVAGNHEILWFPKTAYANSLTSTFVNRNSFATYDGMILTCATALIARRFVRGQWSVIDVVLIPAWLLSGTALLLSGSRGGIISTAIGLGVIALSVTFARIGAKKKVIFVASLVACAVLLILQSGFWFSYRLATFDGTMADREIAFSVTTDIIAAKPWTGTGYGTFEDAFRMRRDERLQYHGDYDKAHNTYLELAAEIGIPATALLLASMIAIAFCCVRGLRSINANSMYSALGLSILALGACHSLVDFSLQIPAVALTFFLLLGAAVSQSTPRD